MSGPELVVWLIPVLFAGALLHASSARFVSGVAAAFFLLNSLAGLAGLLSPGELPATGALAWWAAAAATGGWLGAEIGSRCIAPVRIRKPLAMVLATGGTKLAFA